MPRCFHQGKTSNGQPNPREVPDFVTYDFKRGNDADWEFWAKLSPQTHPSFEVKIDTLVLWRVFSEFFRIERSISSRSLWLSSTSKQSFLSISIQTFHGSLSILVVSADLSEAFVFFWALADRQGDGKGSLQSSTEGLESSSEAIESGRFLMVTFLKEETWINVWSVFFRYNCHLQQRLVGHSSAYHWHWW
jgi:hypothetical protein